MTSPRSSLDRPPSPSPRPQTAPDILSSSVDTTPSSRLSPQNKALLQLWSMNPQARVFQSQKPSEQLLLPSTEPAVPSTPSTPPVAPSPTQIDGLEQTPPSNQSLSADDSAYVIVNGVKYLREQSAPFEVIQPGRQTSDMTSAPRFQRLVTKLAEVCNPLPQTGSAATSTPADDLLVRILDSWNQSHSADTSSSTTPGLSATHTAADSKSMLKVTLIFDANSANTIDAALGGRKVLYLTRERLERILGPETTKSKLQEIRNGEVILEDVLPTTFNAVSQWLSGKAIMSTLPAALKPRVLPELVHMYALAARFGHRSIVHDSVNNMPLSGSTPFEFLETCAIAYSQGCAGVAFRNFFKKGLPAVLNGNRFDHTDKVTKVLESSPELATDFAETMLGIICQRNHPPQQSTFEPFPDFVSPDQHTSWSHPQWNPGESTGLCACGLHECTCTAETVSVVRPSDTRSIPRRSGYVETAPPSEVDEEPWPASSAWAQHDGSAGWDYSYRPVASGSVIPGPALSMQDAENQPMRPRDWSISARPGQSWEWDQPDDVTTASAQDWHEGYTRNHDPRWASEHRSSAPRQHSHHISAPRQPSHQPRPTSGSRELVPVNSSLQHATDLEARLRSIELKLKQAEVSAGTTSTTRDQNAISIAVVPAKQSATKSKVLARSTVPPGPLLHPGVPPVGMPNHVSGYGYNRFVQIGNGVVHPTGPGPYGLAGRTMIAVQNSDPYNCTLVFRVGDTIECVVPTEEGRSTPQHQPWNFSGQRMQGICRTQAGSFPASYVRELYDQTGALGTTTTTTSLGTKLPPTSIPPGAPQTSQQGVPKQPTHDQAPPNPTNATATNVDTTWLKSATPSATTPAAAHHRNPSNPPRGRSTARRSSSAATARPYRAHEPGCPAITSPVNVCTCDATAKGPNKGKDKVWRSSPAYDNRSGWDADDDVSEADLGGGGNGGGHGGGGDGGGQTGAHEGEARWWSIG